MQRYYTDREAYGPEFDDRLIKLVRNNPAIYDVSHPHYRRNPVRVAIWDSIATELGASSRFLQTKWKNIRYNYLQEIKSLETGQPNANIRKRRFTEDLSFLQNTAQTYNVKKAQMYKAQSSFNGSDNDSNSFIYPELDAQKLDAASTAATYEVIEIDNSDDGSRPDGSYEHSFKHDQSSTTDIGDCGDNQILSELVPMLKSGKEPTPDVTIEQKFNIQVHSSADKYNTERNRHNLTPAHSYNSNNSSPLLTPLVVMGNGQADDADAEMKVFQHNNCNGEVTIEPIHKPTSLKRSVPASEIMSNAAKRKSMPAPTLPVLTPINDPIELYCLSLVDSLRNMPRSERERVKFEFANILKDAKYKDQA